MRIACSLASGIVAGVPHSMLGLRYANIRGCQWYKDLHAAYETAKQMNVGTSGQASNAIRQHAVFNGVDTDFVDWVASNVDGDSKLRQISLAPSTGSVSAAANVDITPLAWGALDALSSNLNVDGLSPVAIASLRSGSASVDGLNMHGDAQSVATTFANVKRHWDAKMSDDYVSSSDSFLGVRRAQAKAASFGHFLSNHVFTKNDEAARSAAGSQHADAAAAASLNSVSAEGAAVWNKLVAATAERQGWPTNTSVPQSINAWKMVSASAALPDSDNATSVSLPLAFRATNVMDVNTQLTNIANASSKPIAVNDDAWSAVSFPFAGLAISLTKSTFYDTNKDLWTACADALEIDGGENRLGKLALYQKASQIPTLKQFMIEKRFAVSSSPDEIYKKLSEINNLDLTVVQTWPSPVYTYSSHNSVVDPGNFFYQRLSTYFEAMFKKQLSIGDIQTLLSGKKEDQFEIFRYLIEEDTTDSSKTRLVSTLYAALCHEPLEPLTEIPEWVSQKQKEDLKQYYLPLYMAINAKKPTIPAVVKEYKGAQAVEGYLDVEETLDTETSEQTPQGMGTQRRTFPRRMADVAGGAVRTSLDVTANVARGIGRGLGIDNLDLTGFLNSRGTQPNQDASRGRVGASGDGAPDGPPDGAPDGKWFLIERPFKTFRMGTGILAKGGETLGLTFYGHCNFQWSNNTTNKVHEGHFTFYSRPVVRDWRQYAIAEV